MGLASADLQWVGVRGEMEEQIIPRAGLELATIPAGQIAGVSWPQRLRNSGRLARGLLAAWRLMARFGPDVALLTGGYVSVPVALAAWLRRVPAAVYLPDIEPGLAIRRLSRIVDKVACTASPSAAAFPAGKAVVTGYPVRPALRAAVEMPKAEALARFDLQAGRPTLFAFGGSRGARSINRALSAALPGLLESVQVIHISGELDWQQVEAGTDGLPAEQRAYYRAYPYLHAEMGAAFRAADLAVARAGASMLGECPAFGLPAILVPYPYAWRYQKVNADYLAERGAAVRLDDAGLATRLGPLVLELVHDKARLEGMAAAARVLDVPDADARLAALLLKMGQRTPVC